MKYPNRPALALVLLGTGALSFGLASHTLAQSATAKSKETIGGGSVLSPAIGPAPSYGLGGQGMVLVKNWHFGMDGTVKNYADMSANFYYHDQFGTKNNGGKYGANTVSPDFANATGGQPIEGTDTPPVRKFLADSMQTFLVPIGKVTKVQVWNHNTGNGSFMAKWRLPSGGSLLGRDIVWETRVRYVTPPYYWFALWTAGNKWKWDGQAQGAEHDLVESFGYDNGNGNTNYDGRFWHSGSVANPTKDTVDYGGWGTTMEKLGIKSFDGTKYHIWTWVYKKDNTFAMYMDGIKIQSGSNYYWTFGNTAKDEPIDMDFLFDGSWGHNQIGSVDKELPASAFDGKFYEWNYSRVYLSANGENSLNKPIVLPSIVPAQKSTKVVVLASSRYSFRFKVAPSISGGTFHVEDENGVNLTGSVSAPKSGSKAALVTAPTAGTLSAGPHMLRWIYDSGDFNFNSSMTVVKVPGVAATFVKTDTKTQGSWKGVYGADGFMIAGDDTHQPAYGTVSKTGWQVNWNGNGLTKDIRALERNGGGADRMAGQWGTNDKSYDIDCSFKDAAVHRVALYGLDWDLNGRSEDIKVIDAATGGVLDTRDLNAFVNGKYLIWNVQGHVIFRVVNTSRWTNPALSGIFFDPAEITIKKVTVKQ